MVVWETAGDVVAAVHVASPSPCVGSVAHCVQLSLCFSFVHHARQGYEPMPFFATRGCAKRALSFGLCARDRRGSRVRVQLSGPLYGTSTACPCVFLCACLLGYWVFRWKEAVARAEALQAEAHESTAPLLRQVCVLWGVCVCVFVWID